MIYIQVLVCTPESGSYYFYKILTLIFEFHILKELSKVVKTTYIHTSHLNHVTTKVLAKVNISGRGL